ncbi:MAG: hypothetical protein K2F57_03765 [Candidatus Gastranaerophilales bacterium]|nr:hypothetical protein [Candidatus Gastranaerophilales bacterium]
MKKFFVWILFLIVFTAGLAVSANEQYKASTYTSDMNNNIEIFKIMHKLLNDTMLIKSTYNKKNYTTYDDIIRFNVTPDNSEKIENGFMIQGKPESTSGTRVVIPYNYEVKFYKLKDVCTPVPVPSKINSSTACGKVVIDVNGFNYGTNKYFNDKSTLQPKERGVLWMYSNGVKAAPNSIEDIMLMIAK